jgi:hypothetical protein
MRELRTCFLEATQSLEQVAPDAGQWVVLAQTRFVPQDIDDLKGSGGTIGHRYGDGSVQGHDGRGLYFVKGIVQRHDSWPIGFLRRAGLGVARRNGAKIR